MEDNGIALLGLESLRRYFREVYGPKDDIFVAALSLERKDWENKIFILDDTVLFEGGAPRGDIWSWRV